MKARTSPETETIEAIAEKMQQHWQGGGHAYTRPWNNGTEKDCVHGLPGQAEFFRKLARIATSGLAPRSDLRAAVIEECAKIAENAFDVRKYNGRMVANKIRALAQGPDTSTLRETERCQDCGQELPIRYPCHEQGCTIQCRF